MNLFFNPEKCRNETEVESKLIVHYLLPKLGYPPHTWHQEISGFGLRLDFLALASEVVNQKPTVLLVLEAKHPRQKLDKHIRKFRRYLTIFNARYGLLTNGRLVQIYEQMNNELSLLLQIQGHKVEEKIQDIKLLIGRNELHIKSQNIARLVGHNNLNKNNLLERYQSCHQKEKHMKVLAIYHNKGGVGKTTTVINLAAALRKQGKKVLVIDLDSQANTTYALGLVKFQDEVYDSIKDKYVYHVLREKNKYPIGEVVRESSFSQPEFDVIPCHIDLMHHEKELAEIDATRTRLVAKLAEVKNEYDVVLIDTPPSLNVYAKLALIATDYLIIPSDLKPFANEGLINVKNFLVEIDEFRGVIGKEPVKLLGVLPSKIGTHDRFIKHVLPKMEQIVMERYGFPLMKSRIFERRDLSAAVERTIEVGELDIPDPRSILDHKPDSQSAEEFENLAQEVLDLIDV